MANRVTQRHHIIYGSPDHKTQPDEIVTIFKGEHSITNKINWYCSKSVSRGFIKVLKVFIALNEDRAIDLEEQNESKH